MLANFELFSSGPREIRLSASERYPTNDWIILADIIAENSREIQQFPISANGIYAKFIRVSMFAYSCTFLKIKLSELYYEFIFSFKFKFFQIQQTSFQERKIFN